MNGGLHCQGKGTPRVRAETKEYAGRLHEESAGLGRRRRWDGRERG